MSAVHPAQKQPHCPYQCSSWAAWAPARLPQWSASCACCPPATQHPLHLVQWSQQLITSATRGKRNKQKQAQQLTESETPQLVCMRVNLAVVSIPCCRLRTWPLAFEAALGANEVPRAGLCAPSELLEMLLLLWRTGSLHSYQQTSSIGLSMAGHRPPRKYLLWACISAQRKGKACKYAGEGRCE